MTPLSAPEFRRVLARLCDAAGSRAAFAKAHALPVSVVSETLSGRREPSEAVANAAGYLRRVSFVDVREPS